MGLRDFIRARISGKVKSTDESHSKPEDRRELRGVRLALNDEEFTQAIELARPYLNSSDPELAEQAARFTAVAVFRMADYLKASDLFENLAERSDAAGDWFSVATSATLGGRIERGEEAFNRACARQKEVGYIHQPSLPLMRYYYACALRDRREFQKAFKELEELRLIYEQLKITDDTFVYIRGVPFLSHTMEVAMDVFEGLRDSLDATAWMVSFSSKLDDEGNEYIRSLMPRLQAMSDPKGEE